MQPSYALRILSMAARGDTDLEGGTCLLILLHNITRQAFPELISFVKYHLSDDGRKEHEVASRAETITR